MKKFSIKGNRAFTLIELLVVVLIIGILAAVALPQYQKAVTKARLAEMQTLVKSLADAQNIYFLAHGKFPTSFDDLDISFDSLSRATALAGTYGMSDAYVKGTEYGLFMNGTGISSAVFFPDHPKYPLSGFATWGKDTSSLQGGKMYCVEFYSNTGMCEELYHATLAKNRGGEYYYNMP